MMNNYAKAKDGHVYIRKKVRSINSGCIEYERVVRLLKSCMSWIEEDHSTLSGLLDTFEYLGFDDDDIETLGFAYVLDAREDE